VCTTKVTTLKEIRVNLFYMNKCIFANQRFRATMLFVMINALIFKVQLFM
jgi:hypothetical protein